VISGGNVTITGPNPIITLGSIQQHTTFQPHSLNGLAPVFSQNSVALDPLPPDQARSLGSGSYKWLTINSRSQLYLSAGTYYFLGFQTEPVSVAHFDTASGPIRIFVRDVLMHKGVFDGDPTAILLGYVGSNSVNLEGKMMGTLVAPNGRLNVQGRNVYNGTQVTGEGALYARYVELHQDTLWVHRHFPYNWMP
jgi:hypothetical protein